MTGRHLPLTDDALRRSLAELAGEPDSDLLFAEVMRSVAATPQLRRRPWDLRGGGRSALLVAAVLATLGIGAAVALSRPEPEPLPTPSVEARITDGVFEFAVPFRYVVPEGETAIFTDLGGQVGGEALHVLTRGEDTATIFLVTGTVHTCDADPTDPQARESIRTSRDPGRFLEQLRDDVGVGVGPIRPTTLGNLRAVEAEIDASDGTCDEALVHEDRMGLAWERLEPRLRGPSTLIVARTGEVTIGLLISSKDEEAYAEWLPVAREYADSFVFDVDR